ncbi:preprotein translocase subunit YajC [Clostridium algifaecis]|uniref:Preprotein translocase subunit YajC n=1 Tax=Clostridium algifaecis TaxID=1472040 RepID=A0ABS4KUK0_9CLOT|nr:preprotein translocase subunit YajC [Clostridium algifaecis]MBP2032499.1 preprotein translocase subunit YajC [Clostridium algifaecis]
MKNLGSFLPLLVVIVVCYLFMFLPESKRRKKYNKMISELKVNDQIVTKGGMIGKIINIQEKEITVQTGPDRVKIKLTKNSIFNVLSDKTKEDK